MTGLFQDLPVQHNPGGRSYRLPPEIRWTDAVLDGPGNCYRYLLEWGWDKTKPIMLAGLMNPSTATKDTADATLLWLYRWAVRNGFGCLLVVNADAYRCTDQSRLAEVADPRGPDNATWQRKAARRAQLIVLGYGQPKVLKVKDHGPAMARILAEVAQPLYAWGVSARGVPKHPLRLPATSPAVPWSTSMLGR